MKKIIKNTSFFSDLTNTPSIIEGKSNLRFTPDEAVIRQISYNGALDVSPGVFLLWSNLINDYIASFSLLNTATTLSCNVCPNTVIQISPHNINENVSFQVHSLNASGVTVINSSLTGKIVINVDFIKY